MVFLEGPAGSGKLAVLERLEKLGYKVHHNSFLQHCKDNPHLHPRKSLIHIPWTSKLLQTMQSSLQSSSSQQTNSPPFKHNVVFFNRSIITPFVYSSSFHISNDTASTTNNNQQLTELMKELKETYNASTVLCLTDPIAKKLRIGKRLFLAEDDEKKLLEELGDADEQLQNEYEKRYNYFEQHGFFDAILPCNSSKQAVANLLTMLDINKYDFQKFPSQPNE